MSTYWYFACTDHTPTLRSDGEFTQHTEDEHYLRAVELAQNRPLETDRVEESDASREYFERNARRFLVLHPRCHLELVNGYADHAPLPVPDTRSTP